MRLIFMGTPDFAAAHLKALLQSSMPLVIPAVFTRPDKPRGRNRQLLPSPVKEVALEHDIPIYQPAHLKDAETWKILQDLKPDLLIVVAYGCILHPEVLKVPKYGSINIHASLLPRLRGASPIQAALLQGLKKTGVTSMFMDKGVDTGNILLQHPVPVTPDEDAAGLTEKLRSLGCQCLLETLQRMQDKNLQWQGTPQDDKEATYAGKITKTMSQLDFSEDAWSLHNRVRALNQWPVCHVELPLQDGKRKQVKIYRTQPLPNEGSEDQQPGTILVSKADALWLQTGQGALALLELQPAGKKRMSLQAFQNGHRILEGGQVYIPDLNDTVKQTTH